MFNPVVETTMDFTEKSLILERNEVTRKHPLYLSHAFNG